MKIKKESISKIIIIAIIGVLIISNAIFIFKYFSAKSAAVNATTDQTVIYANNEDETKIRETVLGYTKAYFDKRTVDTYSYEEFENMIFPYITERYENDSYRSANVNEVDYKESTKNYGSRLDIQQMYITNTTDGYADVLILGQYNVTFDGQTTTNGIIIRLKMQYDKTEIKWLVDDMPCSEILTQNIPGLITSDGSALYY